MSTEAKRVQHARRVDDAHLAVDLAVMTRAFADLAAWQETRPGFWLSANLSARHLTLAGWPDRLQEATTAAGVDVGQQFHVFGATGAVAYTAATGLALRRLLRA